MNGAVSKNPGSARRTINNGDFHLLNISGSSEEKAKFRGDREIVSGQNMHMLCDQNGGYFIGPTKVRRKMRLKRRQRDLMSAMPPQTQISTSGSEFEVDDDFNVDEVFRQCFPCCFGSNSNYRRKNAGNARTEKFSPNNNNIILVVYSVVLFALVYFTYSLRIEVSSLAMQLDRVVKDQMTSSRSEDAYQDRLTNLTSNQSVLRGNLTAIAAQMEVLKAQFHALNSTLSLALASLETVPELKAVPADILEINKDLAKFGSRLTDVENVARQAQSDFQSQVETFKAASEAITQQSRHKADDADGEKWREKFANETSRLESKIDGFGVKFVEFASKAAKQIKKQEIHTENSLEIIGSLQDDIQNISAKAASNEVLCRKNQEVISGLREKLNSLGP